MKNKFLGIILITAVIGIFAACDPDPKTVNCPDVDNDGNGHLGIDEDCIRTIDGTACTGLKNYNPATDIPSTLGTRSFQKPIYRVGPISGFPGEKANDLQKTASDIITAYKARSGSQKGYIDGRLVWVEIYNGNLETYTWNDKTAKVLGLPAGTIYVQGFIEDLGLDTPSVLKESHKMPPATAQLQP